ncbi:MAG: aromatic acid exporter family protein [Bacillota bacterium]|nr:aromatic acid exporter family protein [Bacillota bacterium]
MSRFHVGGRVLKTVLAVTLAIFFAQQLGLERVTLAAIVALVTIQRTFYHSLLQSLSKLGSVLVGGVLGTIFGHLFGINPLAYGLVTLLSILICLQLRWEDHIILTAVTAISVIFSGAVSLEAYFLEQLLTALVGAISALGVNYLFTPNHKQEVIRRLLQADRGLSMLIDCIIKEVQEPGCNDDEFTEQVSPLRKDIEEGNDIAKLLREEQRFIINRETPSDRYRQAFHILNSQLERLDEMHKLARQMPVEVPQAMPLVKLLRIVQKIQYKKLRNKKAAYARLEHTLENLDRYFADMDIPCSREEFVSRASIFHLFQEIKRYYRRTQKIPPVIQ